MADAGEMVGINRLSMHKWIIRAGWMLVPGGGEHGAGRRAG